MAWLAVASAPSKFGIEFMTPQELIASLGPVIPEELKELGPSTQTD